ncbi:alpha/beta hydrolase [Mariniflexile maritimum]|uniref:alpha/beta hydrolase n=1 Tax=Mariniflexile maritimum TaxID=2682493 RepID=UPI0012F6BDF8|nr:alpha/beta hydrolase [Mariniflexile maritimum]MCB0450747.1 alpha/beta hydrolase [Confluentibacter sp.]HMR17068.1 alpha/beta hydrolase [Mariniflexile sp.]
MNNTLIKTIGNLINAISYPLPHYAAKQAVKIFSTPRKGKLNDEETAYLKTAIQKTITYQTIPLKTYHWQGKKSTVLLVHGWESNAFRWKDLIEILKAEDYQIIAVDAPAHGNSGSKLFNAVLYSECINLVIKQFNPQMVIGHSIGGTASALAINNHQLPIKKLVLLGAPSNFDEVIDNYIKIMGYNKRVVKAINAYYLKHFGYLPEFYTVENFSKNLNAEGLIIHDKKDRIISYRDALHINKYYKNSKLIKTVGFGHGLKNDTVYHHILEFLNP